ncbi:uncharacterized protein METZ01_LOCUS319634, partial [marine metagenome]
MASAVAAVSRLPALGLPITPTPRLIDPASRPAIPTTNTTTQSSCP